MNAEPARPGSTRHHRAMAIGLIALAMVAAACGNRRPSDEITVADRGAPRAVDGDEVAGEVVAGEVVGDHGVQGGDIPGEEPTNVPPAAASAPGDIPTAAPGQGGGQEPKSTPAGPEKYDSGASATEVRVASVSSVTGLFTGPPQAAGARAYFKLINAKGGVNGRQIAYTVYDDQWDVSRDAALHRKAFEQDNVFAFVASIAPLTLHGGKAYVEQHKIPVVGGDVINLNTWGKSEFYYPQSYLESNVGGRLAGRLAAELGCKRVVGMSFSVDESRSWVSSFEQGLKDRGVAGFVYRVDVSPAETDYSAYASTAKSRNADCSTNGSPPDILMRWHQALQQQGMKITHVQPSSAYYADYPEAVTDQFPGQNAYVLVQYDLIENARSNPAVKEFVDGMRRYEPGSLSTGFELSAWGTAKIFVEALRRMGNEITRDNLMRTLNTFSNYDNGINPPISYRPGVHEGQPCGNLAQVSEGTFVMAKRNVCL